MPTLLIANRGVIARRILRTARRLGWRTAVVYSEADAGTPAVREADHAEKIGPPAPAASYLDAAKILNAVRHAGATVLHPGYGFLSENADFCEACERAGVAFAGPTPDQMRLFGLKNTARDAAAACGIPLLPGTDLLETENEAVAAAELVGYPVMLKSTAGGGGIGMRVCHTETELRQAYNSVRRLGEANFRHGGVFMEKFVAQARHLEVQIFGDGRDRVVALGERDCSVQRRNQKVIEETPAPGLPESVRQDLHACAVRLGESVSYRSAGTVEFLYDAAAENFYFLEVNTRLQVEHGVTEEVFEIDLVEWMLRLAVGDNPLIGWQPKPSGAAIQARIYAEIPAADFRPATGLVTRAGFPHGVRVESWIEDGSEVTAYYDPMLAKIIAMGTHREEARQALLTALQGTSIHGIETNREYLCAIVGSADFQAGGVCTSFLSGFPFQPALVEVIDGGIESLVVDWPGRTGYWDVGVPPSGPFDDHSFRSANRALGNPEGAAGIEMTLRGPTLRFLHPAWCCLGGANLQAVLDGAPLAIGQPFLVGAGQTLRVGAAVGPGLRGYLAIQGGLDVPEYLGSRTTFRLGGFGGHGGRALRAGDFLRLAPGCEASSRQAPFDPPAWTNDWKIAVTYGPHGAPDFFTEADIDQFFGATWEVHYNSARTGVRLVGPKPTWARPDGGEAGLHPSNIHDNAYQVGAIDFTGDMPIILGPDGPSLGGFVCPATVLSTELWKVGQLRPGDRVRFHPVELAAAITHPEPIRLPAVREPVVLPGPAYSDPAVVYRRQGDTGVLVEYGPMVLDLALRFRVQALYEYLKAAGVRGLLDLTPGIRSLQVRYDNRTISHDHLIGLLREIEASLPPSDQMAVPSRTVRLPLSWDDPATRLAIEKYMQSVRPDAPWCPSNIEFIRRINGLADEDEVKGIVFGASYLVMGLGDVYLGAPVATPIDPRHRLVTTKYNPARTWTPENAVGIGGAYMCIYGMEGPGGYQFVGRTVPVWNRFRQTASFRGGMPWLLRFFDRIEFYPVSHDELTELRADILTGKFEPEIHDGEFRLSDYEHFLDTESESIAAFRKIQQEAFAAERDRWRAAGQDIEPADAPPASTPEEIPPDCTAVASPAAGSVWKILVEPGQAVHEGETVAILESMKMEIACAAPVGGRVRSILVPPGRPVAPGQGLLVIEP
ncbi:MAG: urea carboxylase [Terrimicrobiaceae bacterium]